MKTVIFFDQSLNLGKVIAIGTAFVILSLVDNITLAFIPAACMSLLYLFLVSEK